MSHCFTAVFEPCLINGKTELLRHNTRLWFKRSESPSFEGTCVGAVVGLNPGSAKGDAEIGRETLGNCDPTMDRILTTFEIAFKLKGLPVPEGAYVQMLNLFYLRDACASAAIAFIPLSFCGQTSSRLKQRPTVAAWYSILVKTAYAIWATT